MWNWPDIKVCYPFVNGKLAKMTGSFRDLNRKKTAKAGSFKLAGEKNSSKAILD
jgi:hypothetical protein